MRILVSEQDGFLVGHLYSSGVGLSLLRPTRPVLEMPIVENVDDSEDAADLLWAFLRLNPKQRISAAEARG